MSNSIVIVFIIVIPLLSISLIYFLYQLYLDTNKKNVIIKVLSDSSNQILDNERKQLIQADKDNKSALRKKLNYAGFVSKHSEYIFLFISIGFGILVGLFIYMIIGSPIALVLASLIFSLFPLFVLEKIIVAREEEFNFGLKGIIDKVTSMMKSGVGFEQAFKKSILTSKSKFTKEIFSIYINEKDLIGEEKVFEKIFNLIESKELRIFYLVITIGRQSGGKFSNTLETLRKTLHDQGTIKQEITSSTKEIRVGTYMIIGLTVGIYIMMNNVFQNKLNEYFLGTDDGKLQIFFIIIWVSFGLFINKMMTKIKA